METHYLLLSFTNIPLVEAVGKVWVAVHKNFTPLPNGKSLSFLLGDYHHPLRNKTRYSYLVTSRSFVDTQPIWIRHALQVGNRRWNRRVRTSPFPSQKNPRNDPTWMIGSRICPKTCFFHFGFHEIRVVQKILNEIPIVDGLKIPRTEAGTTRNKHHSFSCFLVVDLGLCLHLNHTHACPDVSGLHLPWHHWEALHDGMVTKPT